MSIQIPKSFETSLKILSRTVMNWTLRWVVGYCFVIGDMLDCVLNTRVILLKQSRHDEAEALFRQELGMYGWASDDEVQVTIDCHSSLV